jgi:hypothetical protein
MSAHSSKDRASLCTFAFSDGRRCRTPLKSGHPHFCFFHARKEAQAQAADEIGRDLSFFFSGEYLSACDLNSALCRLFTAVAQGQLKPKTASTLAYLAQTMAQTIKVARHEFINSFSTSSLNSCIRSSVNGNYDYRFPEPAQPPSQDSAPNPPSAPTPAEDSPQSSTQAAKPQQQNGSTT